MNPSPELAALLKTYLRLGGIQLVLLAGSGYALINGESVWALLAQEAGFWTLWFVIGGVAQDIVGQAITEGLVTDPKIVAKYERMKRRNRKDRDDGQT